MQACHSKQRLATAGHGCTRAKGVLRLVRATQWCFGSAPELASVLQLAHLVFVLVTHLTGAK